MSAGEPGGTLPDAVAGAGKSDFAATIERLAALPLDKFREVRKPEADRLRIGVRKLNRAVEETRKALEAARREAKGNEAGAPANGNGSGAGNRNDDLPDEFHFTPGRQDDAGTWQHYKEARTGDWKQRLLTSAAPYVAEVRSYDDGYAKPIIKWQIKDRRYLDIDFEIKPDQIKNLPDMLPEPYGVKRGIVLPGPANKEQLRYISQYSSGDPPTFTCFTSTGWKFYHGRWVYTTGRAIDQDGDRPDIRVDLDPDRERNPIATMCLEPVPHGDQRAAAINAALGLLRMADLRLTAPLMAAVWLALVKPANVTVWCCGTTGKYKTSFCALFQCGFGSKFTEENLMAQWTTDSITSLVDKIYQAANTLLVIDDHPGGGTKFESDDTQKKVSLILRLIANGSGQGRANPDGSQRMPKPPRAQVVATAELEPSAASIVARCFLVRFNEGDIDAAKLSKAQEEAAAGVYAAFTAAAVHWIAPRYDEVRRAHEVRSLELRRECPQIGHKKTPTYIGRMASALHVMLRDFCVEAGVLSAEDANELWYDCWLALQGSASVQRELQGNENPVRRFLELTAAGLVQGTAHLLKRQSGGVPDKEDNEAAAYGYEKTKDGWKARGRTIGWYDDDYFYLDEVPSYDHAKTLNGGYFPATKSMLAKQLAEKGLLVETDSDGRNAKRIRIGGERPRVWKIRTELVGAEGEEAHASGGTRPPARAPAPAASSKEDRAHDVLRRCVEVMVQRHEDYAPAERLNDWAGLGMASPKALTSTLKTLGLEPVQEPWRGQNLRCFRRADLELRLQQLEREAQFELEREAVAASIDDDGPPDWPADYDDGEGPADD